MVCDNLVAVSDQIITAQSRELNSVLEFGPAYILRLCIDEQIQNILREHMGDTRNEKEYKTLSQKTAQAMEQDDFLRNYMYTNSITLGNIPFMTEITYRTDNGYYIPVYFSNRQNQTLTNYYTPDDAWVQNLESRNGKFLWDYYSDSSNTYLRLSKAIYDTQDYSRIIGSIALDFSYDHLALSVLNQLYDQSGITAAIVDSSTGQCIGYRSVALPKDTSFLKSDNTFILKDGSGCFFSRKLKGTNFCLVGTKSFLEVQQLYHKICLALLGAAAVALALGTILSGILGHQIAKPITQLSNTMKKVQDGNLDIHVSTKSHGEIRELYNSFNYMILMINRLIEENYVSLLNQKQSELNALQSQINTHFLYNTLDSINWLARDYHANDISYLVTNLSNLLRTSLNNGNPELTVEQEIGHARSYLNIQQVRFSGLFQLEEDLDSSVNQDKVIKMLLQPLVENAILHAFNLPDSDPEDNILTIRTKNNGDYLLLEVCNNADPEALDIINELFQEEPEEIPQNYGIISIKRRLDIAYGGYASYSYTMNSSGILCASIRIPRTYTMPNRHLFPKTGPASWNPYKI
jgi:two-component system sensor histidine kinase YesM